VITWEGVVRWSIGLLGLVAGCWTEPPLVDGFTVEQWTQLQAELAVPATDPQVLCALRGWSVAQCDAAAGLGQDLFYDPHLSGDGTVTCATCHDPGHWFVDSRVDNNVSRGVSTWTKRNTISLVNVGLKATLAPAGHHAFTWSGTYETAGQVLELAITKPMASSHAQVVARIATTPGYAASYVALFGQLDPEDTMFANLEVVVEVFLRRLDSTDAPFDRYLAGDPTQISESAKRGFALFVGKATCIECHRGPMFSDFEFHDTGVPQTGPHVGPDAGRGDTGGFLTGSLRQIAETGPYMHDGSLATLDDVIWFYRRGGGAAGFVGAKDPRLQPIDMTDGDARDLEAFLRTLTGAPIAEDLRHCTSGSCAP
jgi:cytochrome c peroxidase